MSDVLLGLLATSCLTCSFLGLSMVSRLLKSSRKFQELRGHKATLEGLNEQTVSEATEALMESKSPDSDRVSKMVLVNGQTLRGYTLASNILKNQKKWVGQESLLDTAKRVTDSDQPIFLKNWFRTQFLFIPYELDQEIQSEVFYISQDNKQIRVCPSNKVRLAGLTSKKNLEDSTWGRAFMFLTYLYTTHSELILEGQPLSVYGQLSYNLSSDEFTIDNPIGFIQNGAKDELVKKLSDESVTKLLSCAKSALFASAFLAGAFYCGKMAYAVYTKIRAEQERQRLLWEDQQNKIEGAPIQTRSLNGLSKDQTVWLSGYACSKCSQSPRTIVFQPCLHCYLCTGCYKKQEDKMKCEQCNQAVTKYLRVYTS